MTTSPTPWPHKGINYRMHPGGPGCCQPLAMLHISEATTAVGEQVAGREPMSLALCVVSSAAGNLPTLKAARVQVASLANNHSADWGMQGLLETLEALQGAGG